VLYAADARWWRWHRGVMSFEGLKYCLTPEIVNEPWRIQVLKNTGHDGLELDPQGLRTGRNGGYQAVNLAVHLGAGRIVLLGYDMQPGPKGEQHWHHDHPTRIQSPYPLFLEKFATLVAPLEQAGVRVVNCSRRTALACFPKQSLREALCLDVCRFCGQDAEKCRGFCHGARAARNDPNDPKSRAALDAQQAAMTEELEATA
jgi:hypothetical protein